MKTEVFAYFETLFAYFETPNHHKGPKREEDLRIFDFRFESLEGRNPVTANSQRSKVKKKA
jgi:hypothetical protein